MIDITHFCPVPSDHTLLTGFGRNERVSTCGVTTSTKDDGSAWGSSNLANVTCPACLQRVVPWAPRFKSSSLSG